MFEKITSAVSELGPVAAAVYATHRALLRIGGGCYLYHFLAQPIGDKSLLPGRLGQSIGLRQIDLSDAATLGQLPLTEHVVRYRKEQNAVCLCAFKDGQVIGCIWLCIGPYQEDEVRCLMVPVPTGRVSWDFDLYLHPQHRRGLGFAKLWDGANAYLRTCGVAWSVSRVSCGNRQSLAAHTRLHAQRLGSALFIRLGATQVMISSLRPFVHVSGSSRRVPKLVLVASANTDRSVLKTV